MSRGPQVVTVDGTAGSGKSTIARKFAYRWDALYINSGLLYRSVGYRVMREGLPCGDAEPLRALLRAIEWDICRTDTGGTALLIDGRLPLPELYTEEVASVASELATLAVVRELCTAFQREQAARYPRVVVEGRDAGTEVFPDAVAKWYVDAPLMVRAHRRLSQLQRISPHGRFSLDEIAEQIRSRDARDAGRALSPQRPATGSHRVDTAADKQSDTLRAMEAIVRARCAADASQEDR